MESGKLSLRTKVIYGIGDVGNALVNSAVQFYLLSFYAQVGGIKPAIAGTALIFAKLWDAVNDPIFGWISDRTHSRLGKRRVYMIFGAIPLGVAISMLWFVPQGMSEIGQFVWVLSTFLVWDTLWTLTNVPYYSLTAELTEDYGERAALTASRMALSVPAYILGAALTPTLVGLFSNSREGYAATGVIFGVITAGSLLISGGFLRERKRIEESKPDISPFKSIVLTFQNRPFVRLLIAYMIASLAFMMTKTLMIFYITYNLGMERHSSIIMALMLITVTVFLFPWKKISDRADKGPAYAIGLAIGGAAIALAFFLPNHPTNLIYCVAVVAGLGFSTNWIFPWAMVPDVVEFDREKTGESRVGMFYGVWGLGQKAAESLGIGISGWALTLFGFQAGGAEQSESALLGIRLFFGPIPAALILCTLPLLIRYPITRKSHAELCERLEQRERVPQEEILGGGIEDGAAALV